MVSNLRTQKMQKENNCSSIVRTSIDRSPTTLTMILQENPINVSYNNNN